MTVFLSCYFVCGHDFVGARCLYIYSLDWWLFDFMLLANQIKMIVINGSEWLQLLIASLLTRIMDKLSRWKQRGYTRFAYAKYATRAVIDMHICSGFGQNKRMVVRFYSVLTKPKSINNNCIQWLTQLFIQLISDYIFLPILLEFC